MTIWKDYRHLMSKIVSETYIDDQRPSIKTKPLHTPRRKTLDTQSQRRLPLSLLLLGIGAVLTVAVSSWLGFLANGKDVSLEIKEVEGTEKEAVNYLVRAIAALHPAESPMKSPQRWQMNLPTGQAALI